MPSSLFINLLLFTISRFFLPFTCSIYFQISHFDPTSEGITYRGDAKPSDGFVAFNRIDYISRVGWATYSQPIELWDSTTGKLFDFVTNFSFVINTLANSKHGHGLTFFLAPFEFDIPPNSSGGFLGLFNTTTGDASDNQIVLVEFDSFSDPQWDPPVQHVGINSNSICSSVYTSWNASLHSGDTVNVSITYNATTKNLTVSWNYLRSSTIQENTSLHYQIDLMKVLPKQVMIGFSASTGEDVEQHSLYSWQFMSGLDIIPKNGKPEKTGNFVEVIIISGAVLVGVFVIAVAIVWRQKQKMEEKKKVVNLTLINDDIKRGVGPRRFSYRSLCLATNNFSNDRKLGEGGFGTVYKGHLTDNTMSVAVKRISRGSRQGKREYITEVKIISRVRHRNLVQFIGWCHDKGEFLIVYEFMPNGSLDSHLFGKRPSLPWAVRYKISLGLASALLYLHEEWEQCVVHRDIKSSNVMLDSDFTVKLGDFGLARLMDHERNSQTTGLAGTFGYMAPEYISTGRASKESDVFSYGVVALEIATGRKSNDPLEMDSHMGLVEWIWDLYGRGELHQAMDERLDKNIDLKQIECLMVAGLWCAHPDRSERPSIKQVINVLNSEGEMPNLPAKMPVPTFQMPNRPSFSHIKKLYASTSVDTSC